LRRVWTPIAEVDGCMTETVLAAHDDYLITLHQAGPAPSARCLVTFGGQPSDLRSRGFGTDFALGEGIDTIHAAQRVGTQYQGLSVEAFHAAVAPAVAGYEAVSTYGSSLGGYAALYYGGCIDARIIAAAPMFPAWRPLANRVYAGLPVSHGELRDGPLSRHAPVVIYDPMLRQDSRMVEEMVRPAYPALRTVDVPHGGHPVLIALARARVLKPLILGLVLRDEIIDMAPPAEGTAIWHGERGLALRQTDPDGAVQELERSITIKPGKRYFNELIKLLIRTGRTADAQARLDAGRASGNKQMTLLPSLIPLVEGAGLRA
jgi:hypothetical protein